MALQPVNPFTSVPDEDTERPATLLEKIADCESVDALRALWKANPEMSKEAQRLEEIATEQDRILWKQRDLYLEVERDFGSDSKDSKIQMGVSANKVNDVHFQETYLT